ncbi:unnamed protein product (macronuclear) [Paramecium tetraurelia]|uniref:Cyclic nucleotide-binding domain-containing protein n=1 Tax=Paramecium tetraurelia TaxID=5888 RepID=A0C593_PARTE|nr:uncharacterized protein GSPATT00006459001 [Paramecium tetraurelia]CAK65960.1 unnamed protein product [Paramecium tetraurelia]|eukprot:XP_001433357.1 hypothetical protein (macronuclear) [Paramecium tetraurelia strain d4-2]
MKFSYSFLAVILFDFSILNLLIDQGNLLFIVMSLNKENIEKYQTIKNHPAFEKLNYEIVKSISESLFVIDYRKYGIVLRENMDKQSFMYLVRSGEFKMTKKKQYEQKQIRKLNIEICILIKGDSFGIEHFKDDVQSHYSYTVSCCSIQGSLFALDLSQLRFILFHHNYFCSLSQLFKYPIQIMKNQIYLLREQQTLQQEKKETIRDESQILPRKNSTRLRSISSQLTYADKVGFIIQGQNSYLNNKFIINQTIDEDKYMHESIMQNIRAMKSNLQESNKNISKSINAVSTAEERLQFIKNDDYRSKMKIMNVLGYKSKSKKLTNYSRFLHFKSLPSNG